MSQFPAHLLETSQEVEGPFYHWLATEAGPDDWHRFALDVNWDFHPPELFEWIVQQPNCDKATALTLFWKAQPDYVIEFPEDTYAHRDLVELIRERWLAEEYERNELAFDPETDAWLPDFEALQAKVGVDIEQELPLSMRLSLPGRRLEMNDDIEGIPSRFWPDSLR